jgi:MoxR-like ATPase
VCFREEPQAPANRVALRRILCSQLVGREDEMAVLLAAMAGAREGRGEAVLILGEAGVGKSRLAREIESLARMDGSRILRGRAVAAPQSAHFIRGRSG